MDDHPKRQPVTSSTEYRWEERKQNEAAVMDCYLRNPNYRLVKISEITGVPLAAVRAIVNRSKLKEKAQLAADDIVAETIKNKVPLLQEIVGLSMTALRDFLFELNSSEGKKKKLTMQDAKDLSMIGKNINELVRLETGQSTQNVSMQVQVTHEKAIEAINELKQLDPVFEYPTLVEPEKDVVSGS